MPTISYANLFQSYCTSQDNPDHQQKVIDTWNFPLAVVQDKITQALAKLALAEQAGTVKKTDLEAKWDSEAEMSWAATDRWSKAYEALQERRRPFEHVVNAHDCCILW